MSYLMFGAMVFHMAGSVKPNPSIKRDVLSQCLASPQNICAEPVLACPWNKPAKAAY